MAKKAAGVRRAVSGETLMQRGKSAKVKKFAGSASTVSPAATMNPVKR